MGAPAGKFHVERADACRRSCEISKGDDFIKTIIMRKISKPAARNEIINFIRKNKEAYASDISEKLCIDLDMVFSIMKEFEREGIVQ